MSVIQIDGCLHYIGISLEELPFRRTSHSISDSFATPNPSRVLTTMHQTVQQVHKYVICSLKYLLYDAAIQLFTRKERQGSWRCRFVSREVFLFVLTRAELPCEIPDGHIDPASLF
jgi:hypothetical protein